MIEKVKVTFEQAREIEEIRDADYAINIHGLNKRPDKFIATMTTAQIARALYIGYEVEDKFKVGDWVVSKLTGNICKIADIDGIQLWGLWGKETHVLQFNPENIVRHATPEEIKAEKERRVWAGIGRKPRQFTTGDAYMMKGGLISEIDFPERIKAVKKMYAQGALTGFYPAESFIEFGGGEE